MKLVNKKRFLLRCLTERLTPRSLTFRLPGKHDSDRKMKWKTTASMLRKEVIELSGETRAVGSMKDRRMECLEDMVSSAELQRQMKKFLEECERRSQQRETEHFEKRRRRLLDLSGHTETETGGGDQVNTRGQEPPAVSDEKPNVVNLSSIDLSDAETCVLGKGLNFSVVPESVCLPDFAATVELALMRVSAGERAWVRREVARAVGRHGKLRRNLGTDELAAMHALRRRDDIIILPADKGGATVVMDRVDYDDKLEDLLQNGPYRKVSRDPGQRFRKQLATLLKPLCESGRLERGSFLRLCPTHFEEPHMFGFPKVHKAGNPLRPIVSLRNTLFAPLSRMLVDILSPFLKEGQSYIGNSAEAKRLISESWRRDGPGIMASLDVVSLFTNVPVDEAIALLFCGSASTRTASSREALTSARMSSGIL